MASTLKINTLTGVSTAGSIAVTGEGNSTTTNLQQGLCKSWVNFNGTGTPATRDSFNISSLTDSAQGKIGPVLTNAMSNINFSLCGFTNMTNGDSFYGGGGFGVGCNEFVTTTTTTDEIVGYAGDSNSYTDGSRQYAQVFGDLA